MNQDRRKIIWLASYPKSGNTWMRAFLANYLLNRPEGQTLPLAELQAMTLGDSNAGEISRIAGCDFRELKPQPLYAARLQYLEEIADYPEPTFVKTHMPNAAMFGVPIIPGNLSRCAIYIARNPLDVVISYADHNGTSIEKTAEKMADPGSMLGGDDRQIAQFLGPWSMHVRSWQAVDAFPVVYLRYEDLLDDPERGFTQVIQTIGAPVDRARLRDAIEVSSFGKLQASEAAEGFTERRSHQDRFFRSGAKGQWKEGLPTEIADRITADHREVMQDLGYL